MTTGLARPSVMRGSVRALARPVFLGIAVALLGLTGCKSHSPSQYISPRIEGRVLDSQTRQPLKDVEVRRLTANESYKIDDPPKGGQLMQKNAGVRTAVDGSFVLESERDVALFQTLGWYSVTLLFQHPAYANFSATYTVENATNTAQGEPLVKAGEILLIPRAK